jgi:sec-independent protein translocase protein TatC
MKPLMLDFLARLPHVPIPGEAALLISALLASFAVAWVILIRNRGSIATPGEEGGDLGMIFENPASIMPHVLELRNRLIAALTAIAVGMAAALLLADQVLAALAFPIGGLENIQVIRVTEPVGVWFRVALTVGIILASPVVIAELWIFIAAGLKPSERRIFYVMFPFALLLFLSGVAFAYFVMLPVAVPFLTTFLGFHARPTLEDYVAFVTSVLLWVGVSFEMPLIIFGLAKLGVVNARMLAANWRIALVLIAVLAAVVTPTPDPINMGIVAAPLFVLYLLSIVLALFA